MSRSAVSTPASVRGVLVIVQRMFWPGLSLSSMDGSFAWRASSIRHLHAGFHLEAQSGWPEHTYYGPEMSDSTPNVPAPGQPHAGPKPEFDPSASHQQR